MEIIQTFAAVAFSVLTSLVLADDHVTITPSLPSDVDPISISTIGTRATSPIFVDSFDVSVVGSEIDVLVSLFVGDFSVGGSYSSERTLPALSAGGYTLRFYVRQGGDFHVYGQPTLVETITFDVAPRIAPAAKTKAVEYFHQKLNHYFLTASLAEIASLDSTSSFSGWTRTGFEYVVGAHAFVDGEPLSPVCRFYGSITPGPNSHFYTAFPAECQLLINLQENTPATSPRWNFEENAFFIALPSFSQCPNWAPVRIMRLYNQRAHLNDSNHRYVLDPTIYAQMLTDGWTGEGVVMCAFTSIM